MTRLRALLCALPLSALPVGAVTVGSPPPELPASETSSNSASGTTATWANYRGKVVYLDFWASWCGPCRKSFPWMNNLVDQFGPQGLVVLGINLDAEPQAAERFLQHHPARFSLRFDPSGQSAQRFAVQAMPSSYLIDRRGVVRKVHAGFRDSSRAELEDALRTLLLEPAP